MALNLVIFDDVPDRDAEIVHELDALRHGDKPMAERYALALKYLQGTTSYKVRNAAALALADTGWRSAVDDIVGIVRRPGMAAVAGTLLHALEELDGDLPLDVFVHILAEGSYEARQQALDLLDAGHVVLLDESHFLGLRAELATLAVSPDQERRTAAAQALAVLTDGAGS